jgi:hypothetical protein
MDRKRQIRAAQAEEFWFVKLHAASQRAAPQIQTATFYDDAESG